MIVGIDIDDTMTNHCETWFNLYNKKYKKENQEPLQISDAYKWDFYNDWEEEQKNKLLKTLDDPDYFKRIKLFDNVKEVITKIINSENKVIIISSTYKELQQKKKEWILEQLPMLNEENIIFTTNKEIINVDIMIDDNLAYANRFKCPFLLYRQPWNTGRPYSEYSENIINVGNWKEVENILSDMGAINIQITGYDTNFTEATSKLIKSIKNAKTDKECVDILNPYIKLWQQQGMIIGMKQINDATMLVIEDVIKEMNAKK